MKPLLTILLIVTAMNCSAQKDTSEMARVTGLYKWNDSSGTATGYGQSPYFLLVNNPAGKMSLMMKENSDTVDLIYPEIKFIRVGNYLYKIDSNRIIHINRP